MEDNQITWYVKLIINKSRGNRLKGTRHLGKYFTTKPLSEFNFKKGDVINHLQIKELVSPLGIFFVLPKMVEDVIVNEKEKLITLIVRTLSERQIKEIGIKLPWD